VKKRIHTILFYTLLTAVYGVFFSVESFFNFEGQIHAKELFAYSSMTQAAAKTPGVARTLPLSSSSSHAIRLNKRYHRENIPPCIVFSVEAPVRYVTPQIPVLYRNRPLPATDIIHHPLRGPPVAA
jgi:hypothetical protein